MAKDRTVTIRWESRKTREQLSRPQLQRLAQDLESEGAVLALSGAIPTDASERLQEWLGPTTSQSPGDQAKADDAPADGRFFK